MKNVITFCLLILLILSCGKSDPYSADQLSSEEKHEILQKTIRYSTQLAPRASHESKFDTAFDWYYNRAISEYDIRAWHESKDGYKYFLMTREARSIKPMREAIGGRLNLNDKDSLTEYEEIFRTWKMPDSIMQPRAMMLFDKMVKGESLEAFYPETTGDQYIEYPNKRFHFNTLTRRWQDSEMDSIINQ